MSKQGINNQLTIEGETDRKIRQTQQECRHTFGPALPSFDYSSDRVYYFVVCKKCGYRTD